MVNAQHCMENKDFDPDPDSDGDSVFSCCRFMGNRPVYLIGEKFPYSQFDVGRSMFDVHSFGGPPV